MANTTPSYPHGQPETDQERQDLVARLTAERYQVAPRGTQRPPGRPKTTPMGYERGPIPQNGGYTAPLERRNGAGQTPDNPHKPHKETSTP